MFLWVNFAFHCDYLEINACAKTLRFPPSQSADQKDFPHDYWKSKALIK